MLERMWRFTFPLEPMDIIWSKTPEENPNK
jgi:hypothetical protein